MNRPGLSYEENMFLDSLDKYDWLATIGRDTILKDMHLDNNKQESKDKYTEILDSLCKKGIVCKGQGRGGGARYSDQFWNEEKLIYPHFEDYLKNSFCKEVIAPYDNHKIVKNSHKNKKQINEEGKWINPDFILVWHEKYKYSTPSQMIKSASFEIKNDYGQYVTGVFEATSHSRFVNKSYLVVCDFCDTDYKKIEQRLLIECRRLNVGLITYYHPTLYSSYTIVYEPEIRYPDPKDSDMFLEAHLEHKQLSDVQHWLR